MPAERLWRPARHGIRVDKDSALDGADRCDLHGGKTFWSPDFDELKQRLNQAVIVDGRNLYNPAHGRTGHQYFAGCDSHS